MSKINKVFLLVATLSTTCSFTLNSDISLIKSFDVENTISFGQSYVENFFGTSDNIVIKDFEILKDSLGKKCLYLI